MSDYTPNQYREAIRHYEAQGDTASVAHLRGELSKISSNPRDAVAEAKLTWGDAAEKALGNVKSSGVQFLKDMVQPILHPIDTFDALSDLAVGLYEKFTPGVQREEQMVDAVKDFFVQRYGTLDAAKNTFANDPVGMLSDVSTVFSGGATLAAKLPGTVGTVARGVQKAAQIADPAQAVNTVAGKTLPPLLGMTTGAGGDAITEAHRAGRVGGEAGKTFRKHMRGKGDIDAVADDAMGNLDKMRREASEDYVGGMQSVEDATQPLDYNRVIDAYDEVEASMKSPQGKWKIGDKDIATLNEMGGEVLDRIDQPSLHTAIELDALKQRIGNIATDTPQMQRAVKGMADALKEIIMDEVPDYAQTMERYSEAKKLIDDIASTLSLNRKANSDTSIRKLLSSLRNNVNANFGKRLNLIKQLEKRGGAPLMPALAGETLNKWTPRGLQSAIATGTVMTGGGLTGTLPLMMPRLVGEAAHLAGRAPVGLLGPTVFNAGRATNLLNEKGKR